MDIRKLNAVEIGKLIQKKEVSSPEVTKVYLDAIEADDKTINAYTYFSREEALAEAENVQKSINSGEMKSPLAGVPVALKDNLCVDGGVTTAASKMLADYRPPYTATAVRKIKEAGAVVLGKTNLDEFAMGGSTETSYFGTTKNPWDESRVPGGSSGGSAAAIAADLAPYSLGSDTGGSIRQPSAFCNVTGVKPTTGSVSRYGLLTYASSLDQIGPMAKNAEDCANILSFITGYDDQDSTSIKDSSFKLSESDLKSDIKNLKVGIPKNCFEKHLDKEIEDNIMQAAGELEKLGANVEEFTFPLLEYAVPAYYVIACAEASSNLARFDGVKFGYRSKNAKNIDEIFYKSRTEGFGTEVKRRIMIGSFVLSAGYFDAYYKKALQVRTMIQKAFEEAFEKYDIVLFPSSPTAAYKIGEQVKDPLAMYMADVYTTPVNLAGVPSVALPCGFTQEGLPTGMQFIGKEFTEDVLLRAAYNYQQVTDFHAKSPKGGAL